MWPIQSRLASKCNACWFRTGYSQARLRSPAAKSLTFSDDIHKTTPWNPKLWALRLFLAIPEFFPSYYGHHKHIWGSLEWRHQLLNLGHVCLPPRLGSSWAMWWMPSPNWKFSNEDHPGNWRWITRMLVLEHGFRHEYPLNKKHVYILHYHCNFGFHSSCLLKWLRRFCLEFICNSMILLTMFPSRFHKNNFTGSIQLATGFQQHFPERYL